MKPGGILWPSYCLLQLCFLYQYGSLFQSSSISEADVQRQQYDGLQELLSLVETYYNYDRLAFPQACHK